MTILLNLLLILPVLFLLAGIALAGRGRTLLNDAGDHAVLTAEQITDLGERAKDAAQSCLSAVSKLGELRSLPADKRGETYTADVRAAIDELQANDVMHASVSRILRDHADETERAARSRGGRGPVAGTGSHSDDGPDTRTAGQRVTDDEGYQAFAARGGRGVAEIEVRALLDTGGASASGLFMPQGTPTLNPQGLDRRRLFVRDLLSTGTTGLNSVPYIRELNPRTTETGATTVAEGAAKPEVTMTFVAADAPVRKIAAWIPVTTEILADAPTLRSYIDARLAYMLAVREEDQVLNGDGVAPNLEGITNATGLQTEVTAAGGDRLDAIAAAIAKVELVDGDADGLAMNPSDFWSMVANRSAGDGHYDVNPFASADSLRPWGLPTVRTRSLASGTAIAGAWRIGGQLLDREQTTIRVGDQHSDYFTNNKAAILAEERVAFLNHRPDYFVEITFTPAV